MIQALLISTVFSLSALASSEIPAKREFPVDDTIKPCQDFYAYTCNKVRQSFTLRPDRSSHTFAFNDSSERILEFKKTYFKELPKKKGLSGREKMLQNTYLACMNAESRKVEEQSRVSEELARIRGFTTKKALLDELSSRTAMGRPGIVALDTLPNQDRPLFNDFFFDIGWMSLPERSYYDKKEVVADLEKLIAYFFETIGMKENAAEKAKAVVQFETALSKIYPTPQEMRELISKRTSVHRSSYEKHYPSLGLSKLMTQIPASAGARNLMPKAFSHLNKTLEKLPIETLKDLYLYNTLSDQLDDAYPDFFKKAFDFRTTHLGGPPVRAERSERCTKTVMARFSKELDSVLWQRLFPNFPEDRIIKMAERVRKALIDSLDDNTWLSAKAKEEAKSKIRVAKLQLVAPKTDAEWDFLPEATYSEKYPLKNEDVYDEVHLKKTLKDLDGKMDPARWDSGPLTVNAFYHPLYNKFVLLVGILQYPFFDLNAEDSINLGAIGMVVGHELGHAIDDQGSKYDASGRLRSWMSSHDRKHFEKLARPLVEQFQKAGHNGMLTLGENIGDLVGLTAAYRAAFPTGAKADPEKQRRFFLQYARSWCQVERPKFTEFRLKTDPHSLGWARVNEQIKHQPAFAEAFACKPGDAMVLSNDKRVRIWN